MEKMPDTTEGAAELARESVPTWAESMGDAIAAKFIVAKLIEMEPESPLNVQRQYVLDRWPKVRPIF
jgi:hypothetical protein